MSCMCRPSGLTVSYRPITPLLSRWRLPSTSCLVGVVAASGSVSDGSVNASTALDLRAALSRLQHVDLEPVYVRRGLADSKTELRIRPVQLQTEKIRDDIADAHE